MPALKKAAWKARAERLAGAIPKSSLHPRVVDWMDTSPLDSTWAVGFSGGADSLALLLLLWAHWPARRGRLVALHFNHRLRGAAAHRDEDFCRTVAKILGVRWRAAKWEDAPLDPSESEARAARHAFFEKELHQLRTKILFFGHQLDDVAETMFMRLARGSGTGGLAAPRPIQLVGEERVHLRPLLTLKKSQIYEHLTALKIEWREDSTNSSVRFLRNRTRSQVIPAWLAANGDRDAMEGTGLSRELLEEDDAALDAWLREVNPYTKSGALNLRRLSGRPRALVRRALHQWITSLAASPRLSRQGFNALLDDVIRARPTRHSFGSGGFAKLTRTRLSFEPARRKLSN